MRVTDSEDKEIFSLYNNLILKKAYLDNPDVLINLIKADVEGIEARMSQTKLKLKYKSTSESEIKNMYEKTYKIIEDKEGTIWVATSKGLYSVKNKTAGFGPIRINNTMNTRVKSTNPVRRPKRT